MKFSEHWLRTLVDPPLTGRALGDAATMAGVEVEQMEPAGDDLIFTIKPTPNRGDCLSVFGFAREVAAVTACALQPVDVAAAPSKISDRLEITLENSSACPLYCGRIVRGVNARAATPRWLVQRLESGGLRSLGAIVDITNYVMLELGQPLHAFDRARLGASLRVRNARKAEKLKLLNEQEVELDPGWLVIADEQKALALAGIMGGAASAVGGETKDILLESAFFSPDVIAGKSRLLGFSSDAAYRFERGVDYAGTRRALERATALVLEICGGSAGPIAEASASLPERKPVRLRRARAQRLLGIDISAQDIAAILRRLGLGFERRGEEFHVTPPSYRFDIALEEDLIEEIARIYGYDRIPASPPRAAVAMLPAPETRISTSALRAQLIARDYEEIVSYSFVDRQWESDFSGNATPVALANPIAAQLSVMRSSLLGSLVDCLKLNVSRQQERVRLFEFGRCFERAGADFQQQMKLGGIAYGSALAEQWGSPKRPVDFYDVKSDVESLIALESVRFEHAKHPALHPGRFANVVVDGVVAGWLGQLHPELQQKYDLPFAPIAFELNLELISARRPARYSAFSRLPSVRRDIAVEVGAEVSAQAMLEALKKRASGIITELGLFDVYRGKGIDSDKKSVAFRVVLQDTLKTLTDAEVDAAVGLLLQVLQEQFQARLRK